MTVQRQPRARPEPRAPTRGLVRFGDFELNLAAETLWQKGTRIRIQQQPLLLLVSLLESPGEIVSREELCRRLWSAAEHADLDRNLNTALRKVRSVLRDSPLRPRYVETVRGRGYRFLAPVEHVRSHPRTPEGGGNDVAPRGRDGRRRGLGILAAVAAAVAILTAGYCGLADGDGHPPDRDGGNPSAPSGR